MIPLKLQHMMYGFIDSTVLFACHRLGILACAVSDDFTSIAVLVSVSRCDELKLIRLLNAACAIGLLEHNGVGYRVLPALRPCFEPRSEYYIGDFLEHMAQSTFPLALGFDETLRSPVTDRPSRALFDGIYQNDQATGAFLQAMWNLGIAAARELVEDSCLQHCRCLLDVGGGPGSFAIAAAEHYAHLKVGVFDLEAVRPHFEQRKKESCATDQLSFFSGDFWRDRLPPADVYSLGYVLSDWSTSACMDLLHKVYTALPSGGYVMVLEKLFDEGCQSPYTTAMLDLSMLMETQGQHRSFSGYAQLLEQVGFVKPTLRRSLGEKHLVTAYKP